MRTWFLLAVVLGAILVIARSQHMTWRRSSRGHPVYVNVSKDSKDTADFLDALRERVAVFLQKASERYPTDRRIQRIRARWTGDVSEVERGSKHIAYSISKSDIRVCVRDGTGALGSMDAAMYVIVHELAHIATDEVGHTPKFWKNMKFLLEVAEAVGAYTHPARDASLCGRPLGDSPVRTMELLIASSIGALGWAFARSTTPPQPRRADVSTSSRLDRQYPSTLSTTELANAHDAKAAERWQAARDPQRSGIVGRDVPFFSSFRKQHTNDAIKQRRMELYAGNSPVWRHKKESGPMFQPTPQPITSSGSFGNGYTYDPTRYVASLGATHNNTQPFEQQRVGPGVGVSASVPAADGFHSMYRSMPPDFSYKRNTLEGRVNPGSHPIAAREVDPKYYSKGVPRFWGMDRRPLEKGRAAVTGPRVRPETALKGKGRCHVDASQEYYGIAGVRGPNVSPSEWSRRRNDARPGLPLTNVTSASTQGTGGYTNAQYDDARFASQQREWEQGPASGSVRGNQFRHQSPHTFLAPPTQRALHTASYEGIPGHYVPSLPTLPEDVPQPTLREQLHDQTPGFAAAAPIVKGATVQCTNRQLLKESKRGGHVVNTYINHAERTDVFRRSRIGYDPATEYCQGRVAMLPDANHGRITSHAGASAVYMNQASPGTSTTANMNKLPETNAFQDYNLAKLNLQGNDLHISHV